MQEFAPMRRLLLVIVAGLALAACAGSPGTRAPTTTTTQLNQTVAATEGLGANVVSYLQSALTQLGYLDRVDGVYGPQTMAALKRFQSDEGVAANGQLDAATVLALAKKSPGTEHDAVSALRSVLTDLGYYRGAIDGTWGPVTEQAVKNLQGEAGLPEDGTVGPATFNALFSQYQTRIVEKNPAAKTVEAAVTSSTTGPVTGPPTSGAVPTSTAAAGPPTAASVQLAQNRLAQLGNRPGPADGKPSVQTVSAVLAFEKRNGLVRDGVLGPAVIAALADPTGAGPRSSAPGPRVEIDLDRQILFVIDAQGKVTTLNTSTGSGQRYREPDGSTAVAYTPTGKFSVERKRDGNVKAPLGTLYRPLYFTKGWAIHGSPNISAYPASHGCARLANWDQDFVYPTLSVGAPVWIYGSSVGSSKGAEPGY